MFYLPWSSNDIFVVLDSYFLLLFGFELKIKYNIDVDKIVSNNFKRSVNLGWLEYVFLPISNQFDCSSQQYPNIYFSAS